MGVVIQLPNVLQRLELEEAECCAKQPQAVPWDGAAQRAALVYAHNNRTLSAVIPALQLRWHSGLSTFAAQEVEQLQEARDLLRATQQQLSEARQELDKISSRSAEASKDLTQQEQQHAAQMQEQVEEVQAAALEAQQIQKQVSQAREEVARAEQQASGLKATVDHLAAQVSCALQTEVTCRASGFRV